MNGPPRSLGEQLYETPNPGPAGVEPVDIKRRMREREEWRERRVASKS